MIVAGLLLNTALAFCTERDHSLTLRSSRIIDGTGAPAFAGEIEIVGKRIESVRRGFSKHSTGRLLDFGARVIAPGFIDAHSPVENLK
jgi:N-acyl-D-amino-acid deacylase